MTKYRPALPAPELTIWKYFSAAEFRHAVPSCDPLQMDDQFMRHIVEVRERSGVPMHINSAYRTPEWEKAHGRTGNSFHCVGQAIDIRCTNSIDRYKLIEAAMFYGELSMVVYPTFIHFDNRPQNKLMLPRDL